MIRHLAACCVVIFAAARPAHAERSSVLWLYNIHTREEIHLRPFRHHGFPHRREWAELTRFFRSWRTQRRRSVHPRLLSTLARLQNHFGGRRIEVVSGYRLQEAGREPSSYHQVARAVDLRIRGVRNRAVFEWCRAQANLGCGYYPNGAHVHIDIRSRSGLWVDLSRSGEQAIYVRDPHKWLRQDLD